MKASLNNPIIPGDQLESWSSWSPVALDGFTQVLTPVQLVALSQKKRADAAAVVAAAESAAAAVPAEEAEPAVEEAVELGYPTAAELEAIHQEAWQAGHDAGQEAGRAEGYQQGLALGRERGEAEVRAEQQARFDDAWQPLKQLAQQFAAELGRVETELSQDVLQLTLQLAQQLLQKQLQMDSAAILPILAQALADLPASLSGARLRVNPADLAVAREFLQQESPETVWQWMEDPAIARGGCIVDTTSSRLDMTLPARLAALRQALGLEDGDGVQPD